MARILLIEDDVDIAEGIAELLRLDGHAVEIAAHGGEALQALDRAVPELILLDLMMPVMDGFEFRRRQRVHPAASHVPVIVLTADRARPEALLELDAAVVVKPFAAAKLVEAIESALPGACK